MKDDKTIKPPTKEEMKKQKKKIDKTIKKANKTLVNTLSEVNLQKYNEAKMLCDIVKEMNQQMFKYVIQGLIKQKFLQEGMLEEYNKKIAEIEKENKENSEDLLLKITIEEIQMTESVEKMIEQLNGKFITYNFLLMLPSYFTGIKETDVTYIQELLSNIQTLSEEKKEIMKQFYKLYDEITENNQELTSYMQNIWEELPSSEREIEGKTQKVIDITDKEVFDKYMNQHKNITSGLIDSLQLFEMSRMAETELHLSFDYNKETQLLEIYIQKDLNFSNSYVDITERKVEKLKEEKEKLEKEIQELKEERQEEQAETEKDFKDIKMKTQAISMYKPTQIIFLEGEEISKIYKEQAIVTIPFGLKIENENEVTYQITNLNYEQSDKDLRFFNACISAQWNLIKNKYPINTFIEESTLYQIYIGDTSFTYRPKKKELEKMHDSIMGMNSNQAKMQFESSYNHLTNEQKIKYIDEGTILPVRYKTIEIEKKNGQKYSKKGYVFEEIIPLFSFMNELKLINTAPLQIESVLKSSQMNDEITRILKEEIAQLYYFKSRNKKNNTQNGFKRKVFVTEEGKELTPKEWSEKNIECKKENKKNFVKGYWKYITRRSIDSMIKDCKFTTQSGEILNAYNEKTIDRKTYSRFIDSVITFLRYSKDISYGQDKYIKDFILYDKKGNIVKDSDFRTENERLKIAEQIKNKILAKEKLSNEKEIPPEIKKKITKKIRQETGTNPSIDKIDIIIS